MSEVDGVDFTFDVEPTDEFVEFSEKTRASWSVPLSIWVWFKQSVKRLGHEQTILLMFTLITIVLISLAWFLFGNTLITLGFVAVILLIHLPIKIYLVNKSMLSVKWSDEATFREVVRYFLDWKS